MSAAGAGLPSQVPGALVVMVTRVSYRAPHRGPGAVCLRRDGNHAVCHSAPSTAHPSGQSAQMDTLLTSVRLSEVGAFGVVVLLSVDFFVSIFWNLLVFF